MFSELEKVMNHGMDDDEYINALYQNVINKATQSGVTKTSRYLKSLYDFDLSLERFKAFKHFWSVTEENDRPLLAILYAVGNDHLLNESIPVISNTEIGKKVTVESFEKNIEDLYPQKYSANTRRSMAQNIASSWKQAGFITGKVKNIRTQPEINYLVIAFAFLLAYLNGIRGDFILKSNWVKALCLDESRIRSLAIEAGKRDLLQYQFAGNVTSLTFNNLLLKLNIDGLEN
jgi:ABC-type transport system substrate-binding protein